MNSFTRLSILSLALLSASAAFADTVSGVLVDGRSDPRNGYIGIQSPTRGFFAFDETQMSDELLRQVEACVGKHARAVYRDGGMIDFLDSISCN